MALAALFTEDADFVNVVGLWWTTREQIRDNHAYGFRHMFPDLSDSGSAEGPIGAEAFRGGSGVMFETGPLVEG